MMPDVLQNSRKYLFIMVTQVLHNTQCTLFIQYEKFSYCRQDYIQRFSWELNDEDCALVQTLKSESNMGEKYTVF
jgi:hypothetical protein